MYVYIYVSIYTYTQTAYKIDILNIRVRKVKFKRRRKALHAQTFQKVDSINLIVLDKLDFKTSIIQHKKGYF